jgi:hypothetical protein
MTTRSRRKSKSTKSKKSAAPKENSRVKWPDFAARSKKVLGNRVSTIVDDFIADRGRY